MTQLFSMTSAAVVAALLLAVPAVAVGDDPFADSPYPRAFLADDKAAENDPFGKPLTWTHAARREITAEQLNKALDTSAKLDFVDMPLTQVVDFLRDRYKINIEVDAISLEEVGLHPDELVTHRTRHASLRSALSLILRDLDLSWYVDDCTIVITPYGDEKMFQHVYPVGDLLIPPDSPPGEQPDYETLVDLITATVRPTMWEEVGGPGSVTILPKMLVVSQTWDTHQELQAFLDDLRLLRKEVREAKGGPPKHPFVGFGRNAHIPPGEVRIHKALDEKTELAVVETALRDVVDLWRKKHDIDIQIDLRAFEDIGLSDDVPVTWRLEDITLRSVLRLTLRELDLTFVIRDEALLITVPDTGCHPYVTRMYPIADLVQPPDSHLPLTDELVGSGFSPIDLIPSIVRPTTWEQVGGPGTLEWFPSLDALVICQSPDVQEEVVDLLAALRSVKHAKDRPLADPAYLDGPKAKRLRAVLRKQVPMMAFRKARLQDVIDNLMEAMDVEIRQDTWALEDVGIGPELLAGHVGREPRITASIGGEELRHALRRILRPLDLTFTIRDEVIFVTTLEAANRNLVTKLYDISHLLVDLQRSTGGDGLVDVLVGTVEPESWEEVGGPGYAEVEWMTRTLVVSQTEEVHEQVERVIDKIGLAQFGGLGDGGGGLGGGGLGGGLGGGGQGRIYQPSLPYVPWRHGVLESEIKQDKNGEKVYLKVYRLAASPNDARELPGIVRELVEPKRWEADEAYYLRSLSTSLIVRHTAATHRRIHRLLTRLEMLEPPYNQGFGGGGFGSGHQGGFSAFGGGGMSAGGAF